MSNSEPSATLTMLSLSSTLENSFKYGSSLRENIPKSQPHRAYLLGFPISHSLAPVLHNLLFGLAALPWTFHLLESETVEDLISVLPSGKTIGSAVTMPHKVTFITKLDHVTPEALAIGAINTIFIRISSSSSSLPAGGEVEQRRYIGTNTDCIGVREALIRNMDPGAINLSRGRPALVIGGGGACRSALYALHYWLGIKIIYIVNRFKHEVDGIVANFLTVPGWDAQIVHVESVKEAQQLELPYLVVGTVPDYPPSSTDEQLCKDVVQTVLARSWSSSSSSCPSSATGGDKGVVLEMCYVPRIRTSFYDLAESNGWKVIPGTEPMIWQGIAQQVLWTESLAVAEDDVVRAASNAVTKEV